MSLSSSPAATGQPSSRATGTPQPSGRSAYTGNAVSGGRAAPPSSETNRRRLIRSSRPPFAAARPYRIILPRATADALSERSPFSRSAGFRSLGKSEDHIDDIFPCFRIAQRCIEHCRYRCSRGLLRARLAPGGGGSLGRCGLPPGNGHRPPCSVASQGRQDDASQHHVPGEQRGRSGEDRGGHDGGRRHDRVVGGAAGRARRRYRSHDQGSARAAPAHRARRSPGRRGRRRQGSPASSCPCCRQLPRRARGPGLPRDGPGLPADRPDARPGLHELQPRPSLDRPGGRRQRRPQSHRLPDARPQLGDARRRPPEGFRSCHRVGAGTPRAGQQCLQLFHRSGRRRHRVHRRSRAGRRQLSRRHAR